MPIPQKHLDKLNADLQYHEQRIESLQAIQTDISNEIAVHDILIKLGRDPNILALLDEVSNNPELADQIASNPEAFVRARGIRLPQGANIKVSRPSPQSVMIIANFHIERFEFGAQWDTDNGFSVHQMGHDID